MKAVYSRRAFFKAIDEIVFYHNPRSRSQMVHWMLEEVGAPYRIVPIDFEKGEHKAPAFLAINPMGKLPTIVHRGVVVTETAAIIAYIADNFPSRPRAGARGCPARRLLSLAVLRRRLLRAGAARQDDEAAGGRAEGRRRLGQLR